jgi:YD repeat-containing protein
MLLANSWGTALRDTFGDRGGPTRPGQTGDKERSMSNPYDYQLRRDQAGRIVEKIETVAGKSVTWTYAYDQAGRLHEARLDGRLVCQCWYDKEGRRQRDFFPGSPGRTERN